MYKDKTFRIKDAGIVKSDLMQARAAYPRIERIFLADGDALCMPIEELERILDDIKEIFPECRRVGIYSRSTHILKKSGDDLTRLRDAGLGIIYVGAESGSKEVLYRIKKGETPEEIISAVRKAGRLGIKTSVTFISGLGGKELMAEHAAETGRMISEMEAAYVGFLALTLTPGAPLLDDVKAGRFTMLPVEETLDELEQILTHAECLRECILRSNHASNRLVLKGTLPFDKETLLEQIRAAKTDPGALRRFIPRGI